MLRVGIYGHPTHLAPAVPPLAQIYGKVEPVEGRPYAHAHKKKPDERAKTLYKSLYPGSSQLFAVLPRTAADRTQVPQQSEFLVNQVPSWVIRTGVLRLRLRKCDHGNGKIVGYFM